MSADAIKTVDFPPVYGADIVVSCEKAKDPKNGSIYLKPTQFVLGIGAEGIQRLKILTGQSDKVF